MRRFLDQHGREWDAVVGRGSWGVYLLLFAPVTGTAPVREVELAATSFEAALHELDGLEDRALAELLERSTPKSD